MVVLDGEWQNPSSSNTSLLAFDATDYFTDNSSHEEKIDIEPEPEEDQDTDKDFLPILASNQSSRQCTLCYKIKKFITRIRDNANVLQTSGRILCGVILAFLSGCIFAGNSSIIQYFKLDYTDAMLVRSLTQMIFFGLMCVYKRLSIWPSIGERPNMVHAMIVLQGLMSGFMLIAAFYSIPIKKIIRMSKMAEASQPDPWHCNTLDAQWRIRCIATPPPRRMRHSPSSVWEAQIAKAVHFPAS